MLPARHAQKLNPLINVELVVGQEVFEQHADGEPRNSRLKMKRPGASTPGLTPFPHIERVPVSQESPREL